MSLGRLTRWELWDVSMNIHITPTATLWRWHNDEWDGERLLRVQREIRIGVEWLFWAKSWRIWSREWSGPEWEAIEKERK